MVTIQLPSTSNSAAISTHLCQFGAVFFPQWEWVRESFPRQIDKKSRGPQGERGLEFSRRKKGQIFLSLYIP